MNDELSPASDRRSAPRRWLPLAVVVLLVILALAAFAMRRTATSAANPEDCETKPPPNAFAVPECDDGSAPPAATPATAPKP